jgi:acetyl esterase/lipase
MPRKITNLKYNKSQYLDLYLQDQPGRPLVTCIHGGGFISGDKADERCRQSAEFLTEAGFNCASISYSLAPRDNRFLMWPRNLFDVADALAFLHDQETHYGYDFGLLGMLGFSAGCCLSNLYIQGGESLFKEFGYQTPVFKPAALVGFYGPYDFPSRQAERRSADEKINIQHSPSHWFRQNGHNAPPVLHIQGNRDSVVHPDQHAMFQKDYQQKGHSFKALVLDGFGHSFSPRDTNATGTSIDLGSDISSFFSDHLN